MIKLTLHNGDAWYVNPDQIIAVGFQHNVKRTTFIETTTSECVMTVTESPEEVARKIVDYKMAIISYQEGTRHQASAGVTDYQGWGDHVLNTLAGLEDAK